MNIRTLFVVAAMLGGGLAAGRRLLNKAVEKRVPDEIERAKEIAAAELDKRIGEFIQERLVAFLSGLVVKACLIGAFYILFLYGELTALGLKIVVFTMVAGFVMRDSLRTLPYAAPALKHIRSHGWNPKRALTEFIAGVAFERAYANALLAAETGPNRLWIVLSTYSAHSISSEVAQAVAEIARTTSLRRARVRAVTALATASATFAAYLAFVWFTVGLS